MRFVCGIAVGGLTVVCPLYLSEIPLIARRGRVVGVFQLQVGAGVIVAFSVRAVSAHLAAASAVWKWCLGAGALPGIVLLLLARYMFEVKPTLADGSRDNHPSTAQTSAVPLGCFAQERLFCRKNVHSLLLATSIGSVRPIAL